LLEFKGNEFHFAGHETFPLRYLWLTKAVELYRKQGAGYYSDVENLMLHLGIGKNMARSLHHWAISTKIIEKRREGSKYIFFLSDIGDKIFSKNGDNYLERTDTIWFLHYLLTTNHFKNVVWFYLFNYFTSDVIYKDMFIDGFKIWCMNQGIKLASEKIINRDFICCMNSYNNSKENIKGGHENLLISPFRELRLITKRDDYYHLRRIDDTEISENLFAYCLLDYLDRVERPFQIPLSNLLNGVMSPGRIFNLSEDVLVEYLYRFEKLTTEEYQYDSTSGMRQLIQIKRDSKRKEELLQKVFAN